MGNFFTKMLNTMWEQEAVLYRACNKDLDNRKFLGRPDSGELKALTTDHSLVSGLVQKGIISEGQARHHPQRNLITRCLGGKCSIDLKVDTQRALATL
jgi:hypothetical protein